MSNFFKVVFSFSEPVSVEATVEGDTADDVVNKIRNYYTHVDNLEIHEVIPLDAAPQELPPPGVAKPNLRLVN